MPQNYLVAAKTGGTKPLPTTASDDFGNWTGSNSTIDAANDLKKRGLVNGQQLLDDVSRVNPNDPNSIRNSQSDWKVAAIQKILARAKDLNIRKPEEFDANLPALTSTLNPQYRAALNDPSFAITHPNFPQVVKSILKDQWAKYDSQNSIAKK